MMATTDVARVMAVLLRSDDDALEHFHVRAQAKDGVGVDELRWWRDFIGSVAGHMLVGDDEGLTSLREAIERSVLGVDDVAEPERIPTPVAPRPPEPSPSPVFVPPTPRLSNAVRPSNLGSPWAVTPPVIATNQPPPSAPVASTGFMSPVEASEAATKPVTPFAGRHDPPPPQADPPSEAAIGETAFLKSDDLLGPATPFEEAEATTSTTVLDPAAIAAAIESSKPK